MNIGILGGGNISDTHARAAAAIPGVRVVACYGAQSRAHREARGASTAPPSTTTSIGFSTIGRWTSSPSAVRRGCTPQQGIAAARRGLHVLSEKPLDITTERADALIEACAAAGVKLGVFFQDRLRPAVVEIKRMLDAGELGTPVMIAGRVKWYRPPEYYSGSKWRGTWALDGGGALMNQAIHTVDLVQWMFGPVARVSAAVATRVHDIEVEDTAAAVIEFASGAIGTIEAATSLYPGYPRRLEVTGSEGTVILEDDKIVRIDLRKPGAQGSAAPAVAAPPPENVASPVVSDASAHQRVIEDFIRAIRENTVPSTDGREGRRSVELVETIYTAARTKMPVTPAGLAT